MSPGPYRQTLVAALANTDRSATIWLIESHSPTAVIISLRTRLRRMFLARLLAESRRCDCLQVGPSHTHIQVPMVASTALMGALGVSTGLPRIAQLRGNLSVPDPLPTM